MHWYSLIWRWRDWRREDSRNSRSIRAEVKRQRRRFSASPHDQWLIANSIVHQYDYEWRRGLVATDARTFARRELDTLAAHMADPSYDPLGAKIDGFRGLIAQGHVFADSGAVSFITRAIKSYDAGDRDAARRSLAELDWTSGRPETVGVIRDLEAFCACRHIGN